MTGMIVVTYASENIAREGLAALRTLHAEHILQLADALPP
jgi:hypothetical protein